MNTHGLDEMESHEYAVMRVLGDVLETKSDVPHTILTFATLRVQRLTKDLELAQQAMQMAEESLREINVNSADYDFGPAYEGAKARKREALLALKCHEPNSNAREALTGEEMKKVIFWITFVILAVPIITLGVLGSVTIMATNVLEFIGSWLLELGRSVEHWAWDEKE